VMTDVQHGQRTAEHGEVGMSFAHGWSKAVVANIS